LIYYRPLWSSREIVFESLNTAHWSFDERFNRSIRTIAHVANHLMSRRCSLGKETIPNSLNLASYEKLSRYSTRHVNPIYT
jgi:hypothetical protein